MSITICLIGDLMLGRDYNNKNTFDSKFKTDNIYSMYDKKLFDSYLNSCDLLIGNLETTITNSLNKVNKTFNFRTGTEHKKFIKLNKMQYMSIANNHILDYGKEGMIDTINNLDSLNIKYSGAGININDAKKPAIFNINGKIIGVLGCADHYSEWMASKNKHGIYYVDYNDYQELLRHIKRIKIEHGIDLLILSIHWGSNYAKGIKNKYKKFANDVINAGIDIIHGHSSHHVKCIDNTSKNVIIYGMGDFINDYAIDDHYRNDLGMIVKIIINNDIFIASIIPTKIIDKKVMIIDNELKTEVIKRVTDDCLL